MLAEAPYLGDELTLLVDVGTNAEIVFGNRERLLACSSPTGPAFEGAQISCGQRAAPGAIERVRIDRATLEPRFKVIGCDLWSDEPGFAEATGDDRRHRRLRLGIIEAIAEMFLAGHHLAGRRHRRRARRADATRIEPVGRTFAYVLNEGDAAAPHLPDRRARDPARQGGALRRREAADRARAAPRPSASPSPAPSAAISILIYAMTLGLIPDCDLAKVASAGNAAGTGARIALLNLAARAEIESVVRRIEKIETAIEPNFQAPFRRRDGVPQQGGRVPEPCQADRPPGAQGAGRRGRTAATAIGLPGDGIDN